jgi:hypothetical protein
MSDWAALKVALDLMHVPWRVKLLKSEPLPEGMALLLRIAAGDVDAETQAAAMADRPVDTVREAAHFFIEQILLCPEADSYRALGATPKATTDELRRNMAWLMTWLHPDLARQGDRSPMVARVTRAWNDLKTPERRATYDGALRVRQSTAGSTTAPKKRRRASSVAGHGRSLQPVGKRPPTGRLWRLLGYLLGRPHI